MELVQRTTAAAAPGGDPLEFVMSDATVDRFGDIIEPDGWQLANFRKNPIALFGHDGDFLVGNWHNVRIEDGALIGRLDLLPPVSERLREIHTAIDAGVLRAVSVGFRPIKREPIEGSKVGGIRFLETELVECSLVSVPANPNALQVARSLNLSRDTMALIFGESALDGQEPGRGRPGEPAGTSLTRRSPPMNISERIERAQATLTELKDKLNNHITSQGEVIDEAATLVAAELSGQIKQTEGTLVMLKDAEASLGAKSDPLVTTPGTNVVTTTGNNTRRPFSLPQKKVEPVDYIYRSVAAAVVAHMTHRPIPEVLRAAYGDDEITHRVADILVMRAATVPASTTQVGWAAELVQTAILDLIDTLPVMSVYPRLRALGGRYTFGRNGIVSLPARSATPTVAGSFIAEGAPIPVRQAAFTAVTLTPKKMGVITTMTRQIAMHSTPAIEQVLREAMADDTAISLDTILLDNVAGTAVRPPGLRYNVTPVTPTAGGGFAALVGDLSKLVEVLSDANSMRSPAWIMHPSDVVRIGLTQGTAGTDFPFRAEVNAGNLLGYPVIQSTTQTKKSVILLDAADFFSATGDEPMFDVSDQATIHMEDTTPLPIGSTGTPNTVAAPVRSLWQTDSLGIRMLLDVNWAMRRTGVVTYVTGVTW
jgi:HK97 family phage prohead protease/HK97 family phage major capsid protein